jgi:hypothetical protein
MHNIKINLDDCDLPHGQDISLGAIPPGVAVPNRLSVAVVGAMPSDMAWQYNHATEVLKELSGGKIALEASETLVHPDQTLNITCSSSSCGISLEAQRSLFAEAEWSSLLRQLVYNPLPYQGIGNQPYRSRAFVLSPGTHQYSQVILPDQSLWVVILHELFHSLHFYLDTPDLTHALLDKHGGWIAPAYPEIVDNLVKNWLTPKQLFGNIKPVLTLTGSATGSPSV